MKQSAKSSRIASLRFGRNVMLALEPRQFLSAAGGDTAPATPHSSDRLWSRLDAAPDADGRMIGISASHIETFQLNGTRMRARLTTAGDEKLSAGIGRGAGAIEISIPTPEGALARFNIVRTHIMDPGLETQFPQITTYAGVGIDDRAARITIDFTPQGFHAQVRSPNGMYYVDPYIHLNPGVYGSHYRSDAILRPENAAAYLSHDIDGSLSVEPYPRGGGPVETDTGTQLRTYRTAVAANGEYTQFHGGTPVNAQSAIVTAINRVNQVYELDLTIRLVLVASNANLIFTDPAADPYQNTNDDWNLNQAVCDSRIGSANYDVGHVFTTNGGFAWIGGVGSAGVKARGTSGYPNPIGDSYVVRLVAHEFGHLFGANHTFNTAEDLVNRSGAHAYEPGWGSTIMAYGESDPYFHWESIREIITRCDNVIAGVGTRTNTGNSLPVVDAGPNFTIPARTPFLLTGSATDTDGDTLTYCWEEADLGLADLITNPDNGVSPIMRTWLATTSNSRSLPALSTVLSGQLNTPSVFGGSSERTPTVSRSAMNWRLTVRDNRQGGGASSSDDLTLTVVNTGAGFAITSFNSGLVLLSEGSTPTINWNVAGTTGSGINTANVRISMSADGGNTFPFVLHASTPNDGSESFTVPFGHTDTARFKVEAVGSIFYDINNVNVQIVPAGTVSASPAQPDLADGSDTGVSQTDNITRLSNSGVANQLMFSIADTIAGATVQLFSDVTLIGQAVATGTTTTIVTNGTAVLGNGARNITARQTEPGRFQSPESSILGVTIDTVAPVPADFTAFNRLIGPHQLQIGFSENMSGGIPESALSLVNTPLGTSNGAPAVAFNSATNTATFTFPDAPGGIGVLANGNYTATLQAGQVTDIAGNNLTASRQTTFFFLNGDGNADRITDVSDFAIMSANFNRSPRSFAQGDFNYSGGVDIADFAIVAANFNITVPPPGGLPRSAAATAPASPFASARIDDERSLDLLEESTGAIV